MRLTENRRIVLNILATYGRTLVGVACGIFSVRWVLMALGHENFGLFGVVGSLAMFVTFLNTQFSGALSRFYAFSIGRAKVAANPAEGLENCRHWFTTGVLVHTTLPVLLVAIGYPIGAKVISSGWLTIPVEKIDTCVWLWRFLMISSFVAMVNVPFQAMYTAKQYIAELTIYSLVQVLIKTAFIYYMTTVPGDWLWGYGFAMCIIAVLPQLLICVRAIQVFPECRFRLVACRRLGNVKKLAFYAWWQTFCGVGYLARHQCMEVIVNKIFGPKANAAYTVGATVGGEAAALTGALNGAFGPAVTTAYGAGDIDRARTFAFRACKFGTLLTLLFATPMALEISEVLRLWLKDPPACVEGLCLCWLAVVIVEKFTLGQIQLVNASGNVAKFYLFRGLACLTAIPFSIVAALVWRNVHAIGLALLLTTMLVCLSDAIVASVKVDMGFRNWVTRVIIPLLLVAIVSGIVASSPRLIMSESFCRVLLTTFVFLAALLPLSWLLLFDDEEKVFVRSRLLNLLHRLVGVRAS